MINVNKVGEFITLKRKEKGLTQQQLANKLSVSFQAVSKWPENQAPNSHYDQYDHQQHPDQHISSSSPCPAALFPSLRRRYAIRIHPCILWFSGNPAWAPSCFVLLCSRRAAGFHNPLFSFVHAYLLYRTIITYFFYQSLLICHFKKYFKHSSEIF